MLNTTIYIQALKETIITIQAAHQVGDLATHEAFLARFVKITNYCFDHGLILAVRSGQPTMQRTGYTPAALSILIDGKDGFHSRPMPNRRMQHYLETHREYFGDSLECTM